MNFDLPAPTYSLANCIISEPIFVCEVKSETRVLRIEVDEGVIQVTSGDCVVLSLNTRQLDGTCWTYYSRTFKQVEITIGDDAGYHYKVTSGEYTWTRRNHEQKVVYP